MFKPKAGYSGLHSCGVGWDLWGSITLCLLSSFSLTSSVGHCHRQGIGLDEHFLSSAVVILMVKEEGESSSHVG